MSPDLTRVRQNLRLHGVSWEMREWLIRREQGNLCGLCQQVLEPAQACIDHCHECPLAGSHKADGYGCSSCIRGGLHRGCNVWLSLAEKFPVLQSEHVKQYLARRPFLGSQRNLSVPAV